MAYEKLSAAGLSPNEVLYGALITSYETSALWHHAAQWLRAPSTIGASMKSLCFEGKSWKVN